MPLNREWYDRVAYHRKHARADDRIAPARESEHAVLQQASLDARENKEEKRTSEISSSTCFISRRIVPRSSLIMLGSNLLRCRMSDRISNAYRKQQSQMRDNSGSGGSALMAGDLLTHLRYILVEDFGEEYS